MGLFSKFKHGIKKAYKKTSHFVTKTYNEVKKEVKKDVNIIKHEAVKDFNKVKKEVKKIAHDTKQGIASLHIKEKIGFHRLAAGNRSNIPKQTQRFDFADAGDSVTTFSSGPLLLGGVGLLAIMAMNG